MTLQDKKDYIRQKCIEANPEIVELKFGCEFKLKNATRKAIFLRRTRGGRFAYIRPDHMELKDELEYIVEILGRPIRLADVLVALGRDKEYNASANFLYHKRGDVWNLRKDSLNDQPEATISFIHSLLTPSINS